MTRRVRSHRHIWISFFTPQFFRPNSIYSPAALAVSTSRAKDNLSLSLCGRVNSIGEFPFRVGRTHLRSCSIRAFCPHSHLCRSSTGYCGNRAAGSRLFFAFADFEVDITDSFIKHLRIWCAAIQERDQRSKRLDPDLESISLSREFENNEK